MEDNGAILTSKQAAALLERAAAMISEHFDAVEILASRGLPQGGTQCIKRGAGNWYARQGMAREFINEDVAQENACEIARRLSPPPDSGEAWREK